MSRQHNLKVWPSYFDALERGDKTFEWRRNDRDFAVGDELVLSEWDPTPRIYGNAGSTGRVLIAVISYKAEGVFGILDGFCILGLRDVKRVQNGS